MNFHVNVDPEHEASDTRLSSPEDNQAMAQIDQALRALLDKKKSDADAEISEAFNMDEKLSHDSKLVDAFIKNDDDVIGMIAYAIHGLNRYDWTKNYRKEFGHAPTHQEISAFLIGERTERRLSAYRREAQNRLLKTDFPLASQPPKKAVAPKTGTVGTLLLYLFLLGVGVVATALSARTLIDSLGG